LCHFFVWEKKNPFLLLKFLRGDFRSFENMKKIKLDPPNKNRTYQNAQEVLDSTMKRPNATLAKRYSSAVLATLLMCLLFYIIDHSIAPHNVTYIKCSLITA